MMGHAMAGRRRLQRSRQSLRDTEIRPCECAREPLDEIVFVVDRVPDAALHHVGTRWIIRVDTCAHGDDPGISREWHDQ